MRVGHVCAEGQRPGGSWLVGGGAGARCTGSIECRVTIPPCLGGESVDAGVEGAQLVAWVLVCPDAAEALWAAGRGSVRSGHVRTSCLGSG